MEFLSKEFDPERSVYPVNLVVQSPASAEDGYDAAKVGNHVRAELPFDPTKGFHEYRFDFVPGEVYFYADGREIGKIRSDAVPTSSEHLILQHWSNGNSGWSGGPPAQDTFITVRYVKAYFNSSDTEQQADWKRQCARASGPKTICEIPDIGVNKTAENYFFTKLKKNNKTMSGKDNKDKNADNAGKKDEKDEKDEKEGSAMVWSVQAGVVVAWAILVSAAVFSL